MATRYNITTKKKYEKNGQEKVAWLQVGSLVEFPASGERDKGFALELSMFPDTKFFVFPAEDKKKETAAAPTPAVQSSGNESEEIPF